MLCCTVLANKDMSLQLLLSAAACADARMEIGWSHDRFQLKASPSNVVGHSVVVVHWRECPAFLVQSACVCWCEQSLKLANLGRRRLMHSFVSPVSGSLLCVFPRETPDHYQVFARVDDTRKRWLLLFCSLIKQHKIPSASQAHGQTSTPNNTATASHNVGRAKVEMGAGGGHANAW